MVFDSLDKESKNIFFIFSRYIFVFLIGIGNLYLFYKILSPLTINLVGGIISLFVETTIIQNFIYFNRVIIEIAPACVIASAFYLMLILVFTTPKLAPIKRIKILLTSFILLFLLNIFRILFLISVSKLKYFYTIHWIFWNLISVVFVVGIWLLIVKIYSIKEIPIYSDLKYFIKLVKNSGKQLKKSKKN